ncbi:hypothetical protein QBC39DRAFT_375031 [Podospora conica]|nr:hypothetical protein QBC39DRAFT_375031 [Schizothecium conicum]
MSLLCQTLGLKRESPILRDNEKLVNRVAKKIKPPPDSDGAHAIGTDLYLFTDGVGGLSHDPSLKRTFSIAKEVADCDWAYLSTLRTSQSLTDDHTTLLTAMATTLASVPSPSPTPGPNASSSAAGPPNTPT